MEKLTESSSNKAIGIFAELLNKPINEILAIINSNQVSEQSYSQISEDNFLNEITAFMDLWGDINGNVYLSFNKLCLEDISKTMFGVDILEMGDLEFYTECAKELLNIIIGNSKTIIIEEGFEIQNSLPQDIDSNSAFENLAFGENYIKEFLVDNHKITLVISCTG